MVFKFTIDKVINPYLPDSILPRAPPLVARFLGAHRPKPCSDLLVWLDILIGSFCGIAVLEAVFLPGHSPVFTVEHHAPMIIASYGATAILCFNALGAPLSQPRNILMGHFSAALVGLCVSKLFGLSETGRDHYWASGALSVGLSSVIMSILNCVHPPAGATALLPSIDANIRAMSWWYLPVHLVSSALIISVALLVNNVFRAYPAYWWTALKHVTPMAPWQGRVEYHPQLEVIVSAGVIHLPRSLELSDAEMTVLHKISKGMATPNQTHTKSAV